MKHLWLLLLCSIAWAQYQPPSGGGGGGSGTVTSVTCGTGLSGGTFTTSGTCAIDSTVATLNGTQTLTNKTVVSPSFTGNVQIPDTTASTAGVISFGGTPFIQDYTANISRQNIWIGKGAGNFTTTLVNSLAIGTDALQNAVNNAMWINYGNDVAIGESALQNCGTTGDGCEWNTAVGVNTLNALGGRNGGGVGTGAGGNTAIGIDCLQLLASGSSNTCVGSLALSAQTSGFSNTAVGQSAASGITSGQFNTVIGDSACQNVTTASNIVCIGQGVAALSATANLQLAIGSNGLPSGQHWIDGNSNAAIATQVAMDIGAAAGTGATKLNVWGASNHTWYFDANNYTQETVASTGNVTITPNNNTSAEKKLTVAGNIFSGTANGVTPGVTIGGCNSCYGEVGYNEDPLGPKYLSNDKASSLFFNAGGFDFRVAGSGTAGNSITWSTMAKFFNSGGVSIGNTTDPGNTNLSVTGAVIHGGVPRFNGTNTTGGGTALLGSNSPAVTNSSPYTWIQFTSADGSTVFVPSWK